MAEMSMRERVARAICTEAHGRVGSVPRVDGWTSFMTEADAAIIAMREPTSLMIERGHAKAFADAEAPECYRDMIDAALSETADG